MKIKLSNLDQVKLFSAVEGLKRTADNVDPQYNYGLLRNSRLLKPVTDDILEADKRIRALFDKDRIALCEEFAEKKNGKPELKNNGTEYNIPEAKLEEFDARIIELKEKYANTIKQSNDFMAVVGEIEVYGISMSVLPKMPPMVQEILDPIIINKPE